MNQLKTKIEVTRRSVKHAQPMQITKKLVSDANSSTGRSNTG